MANPPGTQLLWLSCFYEGTSLSSGSLPCSPWVFLQLHFLRDSGTLCCECLSLGLNNMPSYREGLLSNGRGGALKRTHGQPHCCVTTRLLLTPRQGWSSCDPTRSSLPTSANKWVSKGGSLLFMGGAACAGAGAGFPAWQGMVYDLGAWLAQSAVRLHVCYLEQLFPSLVSSPCMAEVLAFPPISLAEPKTREQISLLPPVPKKR